MKALFLVVLRALAHLVPLSLLILLYLAALDGRLGGEPVETIIHFLGIGALRLLLLTLLISPLVKLSGIGQLNRLRRPLGLWCFAWASLHFAAWLWLDLALDWSLISTELVKRTYIILGFVSWLVLLVLAVTSVPALLRKLGKHWKRIHAWVYPLGIVICIHFWWSLKSGWLEPLIYLTAFMLLLSFRGKKVFKFILPR